MGRHCGLYYYTLKDGKVVEHSFLPSQYGLDKLSYYRNIDGRCNATSTYLDAVCTYEKPYSWDESKMKPEDKYSARVLLNHPELDGYEKRTTLEEDFDGDSNGWFVKFFYLGFDKFYALFDFNQAQKDHDAAIERLKQEKQETIDEIEDIRKHQENAKRKEVFNCFQEQIESLKEDVRNYDSWIQDIIEDDYDYNHYMWIKEYLDEAKQIMEEHPEIIIAAYAND